MSDNLHGEFDPTQHLITMENGKLYMAVVDRIRWFRKLNPAGKVNTEAIKITERDALFKAVVTLENGGVASGWGYESVEHFEEFILKAETKSVGRALAAAGFGTQYVGSEYALDNADGSPHLVDSPVSTEELRGTSPHSNIGTMRIVDTPIDLAATNLTKRQEQRKREAEAREINDPALQRATERQVKFIFAIAREAGLDEQELTTWSQELYGQEVGALNRRDASTLIEALQRRRNEVG